MRTLVFAAGAMLALGLSAAQAATGGNATAGHPPYADRTGTVYAGVMADAQGVAMKPSTQAGFRPVARPAASLNNQGLMGGGG